MLLADLFLLAGVLGTLVLLITAPAGLSGLQPSTIASAWSDPWVAGAALALLIAIALYARRAARELGRLAADRLLDAGREAASQSEGPGTARVVDFAFHLERGRTIDLRTPEQPARGAPSGATGTQPRHGRLLGELGSRLARIPSVRRRSGTDDES